MLHRRTGPAVAGSFASGAIAGALLTATGLLLLNGLLSPLPVPVAATVAVAALVLLALRAVGVLCLELPQRTYQIPRETFHLPPTRAAFRFALELGSGVRTYVTTTAPYAVAIVLALCLPTTVVGALLAATAAAAGFGLGRSAIVAIQAFRSAVAVEHPPRALRVADLLSIGCCLVIAVTTLATA